LGQYKRKLKKGVRWRFVGKYLGVKYHSQAIYMSKTECAKAEREKIEEIELAARMGNNDILLKELMEMKLDEIQATQSKAHYQESKRYYSMLIEHVGNVNTCTVTKAQIRSLLIQFSQELKRRKKTNYNANSMLRVLKHLFYYAIDIHDLNMKNPCVGLKPFPIEKKIKVIPTNKQIEDILLACRKDEQLLILFVMETGCRVNEAISFSDRDILENEILLYTRKSRNSNLTFRKVPIPDCIKGIKFEGRLFDTWSEYPRFLSKRVRKLKQPQWSFHSLRHRYASRLSKQGRPLFEIMMLLGHNNLSTTQHYLQMLP
jgi:integrase